MKLAALGYTSAQENALVEKGWGGFAVGRVIAEHRERYVVYTEVGERDAAITGNVRFTAGCREDFPAVGDWVALTICDADSALIHAILPRSSTIRRRAVGRFGESQIIASNVDVALLLQTVDRDFSINRLERYLTLCSASRVRPVIVLTKTDLSGEAKTVDLVAAIEERIADVPIIAVSSETGTGYGALIEAIESGKTYCLLGSSGVGKSTLVNLLSGRRAMKTGTIGEATHRGRHVTSHRELLVLPSGGIIIDNPGMREVGGTDGVAGATAAFDAIVNLANQCRFSDCSHGSEAGCAVLAAVEQGTLDRELYENRQRLMKEAAHFHSSLAERRKKDRAFGKMVKNFQRERHG